MLEAHVPWVDDDGDFRLSGSLAESQLRLFFKVLRGHFPQLQFNEHSVEHGLGEIVSSSVTVCL